ncbi:MAG: peptidoglycan DD-metalloendopeptidase family protein [Maricaulis sp.]|jgi:septal ring factor EnvC (AmiA/AmiB activator)|nr:peptidoglycan DD-metalloendopeptidase family protein [Maricaulis sp.]MDG2043620.1 peptidoglycan DD-metalloendopeptidase family protein [Maricaulis sp.]
MLSLLLALTLGLTQPPDVSESEDPDPAEAARLEAEQEQARLDAAASIAAAAELADEITRLQRQLVDAARRASDSEAAALQAETAISGLTEQEAQILARLYADRESLIDVLAALQRIETQTPPAILAAPDDAAEAARAASLMATLAPHLRERARLLADELDELRSVRAATLTQRETLTVAETALLQQRDEIEALILRRRALESQRRDEADAFASRASRLGDRAQSIRSLISELSRMAEVMPTLNPRRRSALEGAPEPRMRPTRTLVAARAPTAPLQSLRFVDAHGQLSLPATGQFVRNFGDADTDGALSEGIFIRTRARAQVISPFDARVEFAGPFNTYGGLLILNVGDNYYMILSGLSATFATAGQSVLAGEPVGTMPDSSEPAPELYLEIRRGNTAVDPRPWLRVSDQAG